MKIKTIAAAVTAAALMAGSAFAANATDSDIAQLQQQVKQLQSQINALGDSQSSASSSATDSKTASASKLDDFIQTKPKWSRTMTNNQHITNRDLAVLKSRADGELTANTIYLGGKGEIDSMFTRTTGGATSTSLNKSQILMPFVDIIFTAAIGDWITGFADMQVGDQFGTVGVAGQNAGSNAQNSNVTLPQAFFVIGNSNETPLFSTFGVKVIDFGDFRQENTLLPTLTQYAFMAQGGQVAVGYNKEGLSAIITFMNGGGAAQTNSATQNGNAINNFAVNIAYDVKEFHAGIGYINATGFNSNGGSANWGTSPLNTANGRVGAITINAGVDMDLFSINADYVMTTKKVNGLNNSSAFNVFAGNTNGYAPLNQIIAVTPGSFNSRKTLNSWDLNGAFNLSVIEHDVKIFSSYSQMMQDSNNSIYQFVVGARANILDTVWVGPSYQYSGGKLGGTTIPSTNTLLLDATAFF